MSHTYASKHDAVVSIKQAISGACSCDDASTAGEDSHIVGVRPVLGIGRRLTTADINLTETALPQLPLEDVHRGAPNLTLWSATDTRSSEQHISWW